RAGGHSCKYDTAISCSAQIRHEFRAAQDIHAGLDVAAANENEVRAPERLVGDARVAGALGELGPHDLSGASRGNQPAQSRAEILVVAARSADVERERRLLARELHGGFEVGTRAEMAAAELAGDQRDGLAQPSSFSLRCDSSRPWRVARPLDKLLLRWSTADMLVHLAGEPARQRVEGGQHVG